MVTLHRIVVVGSTGSGKTTLAARAAGRLGTAHIEMDALFWGPNWSPRPYDELRPLIDEVTDEASWVLDGNYSRIRDIVWPKADTVVWLDYGLQLIMWRLWWRTMRRVFLREILWNHNRERFWSQFLSRESLFLWVLKKYHVYRHEYPLLFKQPEYEHLEVIHLRSPRDTESWLLQLADTQPTESGNRDT